MYEVKVIEDSISRCGVRLTTLAVTLPRIVLAEFNTHRVFSRNSASSRAIPVEKRIRDVKSNPFVPEAFAANQRGMQAGGAIHPMGQRLARCAWLTAMHTACFFAWVFTKMGVHKQWANRLIEPFSWTTIVVSSTEWENFFALRVSKLAQPEIRTAAAMMERAMLESHPVHVAPGGWHLPYVTARDVSDVGRPPRREELAKLSVARCARVSYLTHDGKRDLQRDFELHDSLLKNRHMSPFEHAAFVADEMDDEGMWDLIDAVRAAEGTAQQRRTALQRAVDPVFVGNFRYPWTQYRKTIKGEDVAPREEE